MMKKNKDNKTKKIKNPKRFKTRFYLGAGLAVLGVASLGLLSVSFSNNKVSKTENSRINYYANETINFPSGFDSWNENYESYIISDTFVDESYGSGWYNNKIISQDDFNNQYKSYFNLIFNNRPVSFHRRGGIGYWKRNYGWYSGDKQSIWDIDLWEKDIDYTFSQALDWQQNQIQWKRGTAPYWNQHLISNPELSSANLKLTKSEFADSFITISFGTSEYETMYYDRYDSKPDDIFDLSSNQKDIPKKFYLSNFKNFYKLTGKAEQRQRELESDYPNGNILTRYYGFWLYSFYDVFDCTEDFLKFQPMGITLDRIKATFYLSENRQDEVNNLINLMRNKIGNSIVLYSDTGWENGGLKQNISSGTNPPNATTNIYKLNSIIENKWSELDTKNYNFLIQAGNNQFDLYIKVPSIENNARDSLKLIKSNINIDWKNSALLQDFLDSLNIQKRFKIIPSKVFGYDNSIGKYKYKKDEPYKLVAGGSPQDWGTWIYHGTIKLNFLSSKKNNEILFVDDNKVDVLNNKFEIDLRDYMSQKQQPDSNEVIEERKNEYLIEIKTYNQDSNGNNTSVKHINKIKIIIQSFANDFDVSYFGWNPEFNPEQRLLIEPFLKDSNGDILLDENGNKVQNPKYDALIDPKTGTKKELIWVKNRSVPSNFKDYISFLPDPLNANGDFIFNSNLEIQNPNYVNGFLAEASVIPKGINISNVSNYFNGNYVLGKIEPNRSWITEPKNVKFGTENDYISNAGVYFASAKHSQKDKFATIKLIGFGNVAWDGINPPGLFSEQYIDNSSYGWLPFWDSYQGKHLKNYLIKSEKFSDEKINALTYPEVISYWKSYVSKVVVSQAIENNNTINVVLNETKIKNYALNFNQSEFNPSPADLRSFLGDFEKKEFVQPMWKFYGKEQDSSIIEFSFKLFNTTINQNILPEKIFVDVIFKNQIKSGELINLKVDKTYLQQIINSNTKQDFLENWDIFVDKKKLFISSDKNIDKVDFEISYDHNLDKVILRLFIKKDFENQFHLNEYKFFFEPNFLENGNYGIFENLPNKFNLSSLFKNENEIVEKIKQFANENIKDFVLNDDYTFIYDKSLLKNLVVPAVITNSNPFVLRVQFKTLKDNLSGYKVVKIYNQLDVDTIPNVPDYDLSKIKINDLEYHFDSVAELKAKLVSDLNQELKQYNLKLDQSVEIRNLDAILDTLFISAGKYSVDLKIVPKIGGLNNHISVKLTNTTKIGYGFDLSKIKIDNLVLQKLTKPDAMLSAINEHLSQQIFNIYNIKKEELKIGLIYINDSNEALWIDYSSTKFLRMLVEKNPPEWQIEKQLIIRDKNDTFTYEQSTKKIIWKNNSKFKNQISFSVLNSSNPDVPYDPDKDDIWDKEVIDDSNLNETSRVWKIVLGSLAAILLISVAATTTVLYFRKKSKKIK